MREVLKRIGPALREVGFRGSGQTFRKREDDFVFVINFQGSRWGDFFFVNLGAQPTFIPAEGNASLTTLKEHECVLRRRVGEEWPWELSDRQFASFMAKLMSTQGRFFARAGALRAALATETPEALIKKFSTGTTHARASLHLARAAHALGHHDLACRLAHRGIKMAGPQATILVAEFRDVLRSAST